MAEHHVRRPAVGGKARRAVIDAGAWIWRAAAGLWARLPGASRLAFRALMPPLRAALQVALALVILLEEWGWHPLAELLGRLVRWQPWARLETAIGRLPPYLALAVFALPTLLLLPLKFLALLLIAKGHLVTAGLLFAAAKVGATALVARLFLLTRPALMRIAWFAWGYERFIPWKTALEEYVRASAVWRFGRLWKARIKRIAAVQLQRLRPLLVRLRETARMAAVRCTVQARQIGRALKARWAASGQ